MRNKITLINFLMIIAGFCSCNPNSAEKSAKNVEKKTQNKEIKNDFESLVKNRIISIKGTGLKTYKSLKVTIVNQSENDLHVKVPAGTFFKNPNPRGQSLIMLEPYTVYVPAQSNTAWNASTACTNAGWKLPGTDDNWPLEKAPKNLDIALRFYGNHQQSIDAYLARKNPEKLGSKEQQKRFKQVVIWYYMGNSYAEIKNMLAESVFHNDIAKAEDYLNSVKEDAQDISNLIRNQDKNGLKALLKNRTQSTIQQSSARMKKFRNRFNH